MENGIIIQTLRITEIEVSSDLFMLFFLFYRAALHNGAVTNEMDADGFQKIKRARDEREGEAGCQD